MSAFICSDFHIVAISIEVSKHFDIDCQELADNLKRINTESFNYRYNEKTPKRKCKINRIVGMVFSASDIEKLIACWDYQACEKKSPDYSAYSSLLFRWVNENQGRIDKCQKSSLWSI